MERGCGQVSRPVSDGCEPSAPVYKGQVRALGKRSWLSPVLADLGSMSIPLLELMLLEDGDLVHPPPDF